MTPFDREVIKMSHICTVQQLQDAADVRQDSYEHLETLSLTDLETKRDGLIKIYNKAIKGRRFAADIIYNRRHHAGSSN